MTAYKAWENYWNGASYVERESIDLNASTLDEAIREVKGFTFEGDYDVQVEIIDEEGDTVHIEYFEGSVAEARQDEMEIVCKDRGEFSTDYLGRTRDENWSEEETYYTWTRNGGSRGAHDRMDGDGVWRERYEMPKAIWPAEAVKVMDEMGMDDCEIVKDLSNAGHGDDVRDILTRAGWDEDRIDEAMGE